jgi:uncharacterized protein (TIGR03086 family)
VHLIDAFVASADRFREQLAEFTAQDWERPTPCEAWSVADLLNHVLGGELRYTMLLAGAPTDQVEATRSANYLDPSPLSSFDRLHAELRAAFLADRALERVTHHRLGDRVGRDLLAMRVGEYTLHGWDLGQARGSPATIEAEVAQLLLDEMARAPALWFGPGVFAPPIATAPTAGADPAVRLLHRTGRG